MSFHQYFFPEMEAHDLSCPIAKASGMPKNCYIDQAHIDSFVRSNDHQFQLRSSDNKLLYQPLVKAEEIRVLEIHPAPFDAGIDCTLRHCYIDFEYPARPYTATTTFKPTSHALSIEGTPLWYTTVRKFVGQASIAL
jgi:hypothetical protein